MHTIFYSKLIMRIYKKAVYGICIIYICTPLTSYATTRAAASCSNVDVQTQINASVSGDTVTVPAGNCTWTSTVLITSKRLVLTGAGIGVTNITDQGSGGAALQVDGASATNFVDISGFTFIKGANHSSGIIQISGQLFSVAFRFHHNRILQGSVGSRGIYIYEVYGLIDHNTIDVTAIGGSIQSISIDGSSISTDGGFTPWQQPLTLGTANAVYVEDNVITYDTSDTGAEDALDAYSGARFVVRHNTINNISMGHHGTDSGGNRGPVSFEVYENTWVNNSTTKIRGWTVRGGTGVFFNNTYSGTISSGWYEITLLVYRACSTNVSDWQVCDGTHWELGSTDFSANGSRQCSLNGGVRFLVSNPEQVTTASSGIRYFDGSGVGGYPCRDQPGIGPGQVSEPIYAWNNTGSTIGTYDMGDPLNCQGHGINNYILLNRDYYSGTARPGYTSYTYPHPLQTGGGTDLTPPIAPSGVYISQIGE